MFEKITDMETAKKAAKQGFYASIFTAIVTFIMAIVIAYIYPVHDIDYLDFLDAAFPLVLGFGIYKMSRIAAVLGFIMYSFGLISVMITNGPRFNFLGIVIVAAYINAIRGTFAYHKYKKEASDIGA